MDTNSEMNIEDLLPKALKESLSEESLQKITEAFNNAVETKVNEKLQLAVESAMASYDEQANAKINDVVTAIDEAHKVGLMKAVRALKESYEGKVRGRIKRYNAKSKRIVENAKVGAMKFKRQLVESLSDFIDKHFEEVLPVRAIKAAVKNDAAMRVVESLRNVLNVTDKSAMDVYIPKLKEAKALIESKTEKIKEYDRQLRESKLQNSETEAKLMLESLSSGLPTAKKNYIKRMMDGKTAKYIKENFDYAMSLLNEREAREVNVIKERTMAKAAPKTATPSRKKIAKTLSRINESASASDSTLSKSLFDQMIDTISKDAERE